MRGFACPDELEGLAMINAGTQLYVCAGVRMEHTMRPQDERNEHPSCGEPTTAITAIPLRHKCGTLDCAKTIKNRLPRELF